MIIRILSKEFLQSITTLRFATLVFICCLLLPASISVLSSNYLKEMDDYQGRKSSAERAQNDPETYSLMVNRPFPQLSALFGGVSLKAVNSIELRNNGRWNRPISAATPSITADLFPAVDLTFIAGVVLSLMALMMSFDAISGEKVKGTLKLVLSNSVSRASVLLGKWLGLTLVILFPLSVGLIISLLLFFSITGMSLSAGNWVALGIQFGAIFLFVGLFTAIGITISAFTSTPTRSIFVCLTVWGLLAFIIPQGSLAAADAAVPVPAVQQIERTLRNYFTEFARGVHDFSKEQYYRGRAEGWDIERVWTAYLERLLNGQINNLRRSNNLEREFWLAVENNERLGRVVSMASPVACLSQALIALADTGMESQREFLRSAYDYGERYFEELWLKRDGRSSEEIIKSFPRFEFRETALQSRLAAAAGPLAVPPVLGVVLLFVAVVRFNNYDVR
jgi:ABC-type transport system involved in multi-copper enzyme maturation permease subunit